MTPREQIDAKKSRVTRRAAAMSERELREIVRDYENVPRETEVWRLRELAREVLRLKAALKIQRNRLSNYSHTMKICAQPTGFVDDLIKRIDAALGAKGKRQ